MRTDGAEHFLTHFMQHLHGHMECQWSTERRHFINIVAVGHHDSAGHLRYSIPGAWFVGKSIVGNTTWSKLDVSIICVLMNRLWEAIFIRFIFCRRKIMESLNPNTSYEELVSVRLAGMMLVIIVRQELRKNVLRYSTQSVGTGALNFMVIHFARLIECLHFILSTTVRFFTIEIGQ